MPDADHQYDRQQHARGGQLQEWQPRIRNSRLVTIEGDAWHAAGAYPDRCAEETLEFIEEHL